MVLSDSNEKWPRKRPDWSKYIAVCRLRSWVTCQTCPCESECPFLEAKHEKVHHH